MASSTPTSYAPLQQMLLHTSMSSPYLSLTREHLKNGSSSDVASLQYLRARMLSKAPQVTRLQRHFLKVTQHVFPEKTCQIQKCYMWRNIHYGRDFTMKEWVAQVQELNGYLKDFPAHNRNPTQPLDVDELLDILKFGVPASWRRDFTVQGFDPMDQG
eukprot:12361228-Ditylum_brightwellii.AAC.1